MNGSRKGVSPVDLVDFELPCYSNFPLLTSPLKTLQSKTHDPDKALAVSLFALIELLLCVVWGYVLCELSVLAYFTIYFYCFGNASSMRISPCPVHKNADLSNDIRIIEQEGM